MKFRSRDPSKTAKMPPPVCGEEGGFAMSICTGKARRRRREGLRRTISRNINLRLVFATNSIKLRRMKVLSGVPRCQGVPSGAEVEGGVYQQRAYVHSAALSVKIHMMRYGRA